MNLTDPTRLGIHVLAAIALIGVIVLAAVQQPIPGILADVVLVAIGGAAGVTLPSHAHVPDPAADPAGPALDPQV